MAVVQAIVMRLICGWRDVGVARRAWRARVRGRCSSSPFERRVNGGGATGVEHRALTVVAKRATIAFLVLLLLLLLLPTPPLLPPKLLLLLVLMLVQLRVLLLLPVLDWLLRCARRESGRETWASRAYACKRA